MNKIKYILWDLDGTLSDFDKAEEISMQHLFNKYIHLELTNELFDDYKVINSKYWHLHEQGKLTRDETMINRFIEFFDKYKINGVDPKVFNDDYQDNLGRHAICSENAYEVVTKLKGKYKEYIASNGPTNTQLNKLRSTKLDEILDGNFISQELGYNKPDISFFNEIFDRLNDSNPDHYIMIGDSLSSDILGGNKVNIKTVWYNPKHKENKSSVIPDYTITNLVEILDIL